MHRMTDCTHLRERRRLEETCQSERLFFAQECCL